MKTPMVSVIMNCYNSAKFLQETLESVLSQSFQDWELIFWDNQSSDKSAEIFKSFNDPRFCYYRAKKHENLGKARNLAVSKAKGTWLAFLDCDDIWIVDKLEKQLSQVGSLDDRVGMIYSPVEYKIETNQGSHSSLENYYKRKVITPHRARSVYHELLLNGNTVIFSTLLVLHDLYIQVGGIDDTLSQNEDYDLVLKVSRISNAVCVEGICAIYRIHDSNNSHDQAQLNYKENFRIYHALPPDKFIDSALKINASRFAIYKIKNGQIFTGIKYLFINGSPLWSLKRILNRFFKRVGRSFFF